MNTFEKLSSHIELFKVTEEIPTPRPFTNKKPKPCHFLRPVLQAPLLLLLLFILLPTINQLSSEKNEGGEEGDNMYYGPALFCFPLLTCR